MQLIVCSSLDMENYLYDHTVTRLFNKENKKKLTFVITNNNTYKYVSNVTFFSTNTMPKAKKCVLS